MSPPPSGTPKPLDGEPPTHRDEPRRSGEGAQTALQALIRKRKLVETPQEPEADPPQPPAEP